MFSQRPFFVEAVWRTLLMCSPNGLFLERLGEFMAAVTRGWVGWAAPLLFSCGAPPGLCRCCSLVGGAVVVPSFARPAGAAPLLWPCRRGWRRCCSLLVPSPTASSHASLASPLALMCFSVTILALAVVRETVLLLGFLPTAAIGSASPISSGCHAS